MSNRRIVVTGGSGFIGSRVARRLAERGDHIIAVVRKLGDHAGLDHPQIEQYPGNFYEPAVAEAACAGADAVVHSAAALGGDLEEARLINVTGTAVMAAAARAAGCRRFVHISTLAVFAVTEPEAMLDEDAPLKTEGDKYGLTKAEAERALQPEAERGLPVVVLRPGAVLGVHRTSTWATKVPQAIRQGKLPLRGEGRDRLPWVHVEDLVTAVELALDRPEAVGRVYNVADGHWEWRDYIETVRSWFPEAPPAPRIPLEQLSHPAEYFTGGYCADRIRQELDYAPRHTYAEGMAEAAAQFQTGA
jgi:nucleoside-diphosphate-sugar epimerase